MATQSLIQRINRKVPLLIEKWRGLDFVLVVRQDELGLDEKLVHLAAPTGDKYFDNVFADLSISPSDRLLDVGCAKGNAMRYALKYPFGAVDGIELASSLAAIAAKNFQKLGQKKVKVFDMNALDFESYGQYNVLYFANPFPESIMRLVMAKITNSAPTTTETLIVYYNPTCHATMLDYGFVTMRDYPGPFGNGFRVYSNLPNKSRLKAAA